MKQPALGKPFGGEEEYFAFEEKSELKHEYINSTFFETSGVSKHHNSMVITLVVFLKPLLKNTGAELYVYGHKVRTLGGNFFYPDIIISEPNSEKYFTERPMLIIEVLSESTKTFDLTHKFIQYRKFTTLQYYLCIEPETEMVLFYYKTDEREWHTDIFTRGYDIINLAKLGISISSQDIYQV